MTVKTKTLLFFLVITSSTINAQRLITTSNKCYKQIQEGNKLNDSGQYQQAFDTFTKVLKDCSAKDAKEDGNIGMATASNGLQQYERAIDFANSAIKVSKKTSVMAYYARSYAYGNLGQTHEAREDIIRITELTKKNKNVKARATMYAQLAHLDFQLNRLAEADSNLVKAAELDPSNPLFFIQKGDMMVKIKNYEDAFAAYDTAQNLGKNDLEVYQIRTEARLKQVQEKYNTSDSKVLAQNMTASEKTILCADLTKAVDLGLRNLYLELLGSMICE